MPTYTTIEFIKDYLNEFSRNLYGRKVKINGVPYKKGMRVKLHISTASRIVREGFAIHV